MELHTRSCCAKKRHAVLFYMTLWRSPLPDIVQQFVDAVESSCSSACLTWPPQHTHPRHKSAALNVYSVHPSRPALARSRVSPVTVLGRLCSSHASAVVCQPSSHTAQPSQLCHRYRISSSQRDSILLRCSLLMRCKPRCCSRPARSLAGRRPDGGRTATGRDESDRSPITQSLTGIPMLIICIPGDRIGRLPGAKMHIHCRRSA